MLSNVGAFTNPYEYREIMMAVVGYSDRTVEEVQAEHEAKREQQAQDVKMAKGRKPTRPAPARVTAQPKSSELDKLAALMAAGRQVQPPVVLDDHESPS